MLIFSAPTTPNCMPKNLKEVCELGNYISVMPLLFKASDVVQSGESGPTTRHPSIVLPTVTHQTRLVQ